jgi:hypothetical protein
VASFTGDDDQRRARRARGEAINTETTETTENSGQPEGPLRSTRRREAATLRSRNPETRRPNDDHLSSCFRIS